MVEIFSMKLAKKAQDQVLKLLMGKNFVPKGLSDLNRYFRDNGPINFEYKKEGDVIVVSSKNFRHGSIVTFGKNKKELDSNVEDAILTSFEVPSAYAKEANLHRVGQEEVGYAVA